MRSLAEDIPAQEGASDLDAGLPNAGPLLGRYELLMRVASGGMSNVWAARLRGTRGFQKIVALKTILPCFSTDSKYQKMFLDEAMYAGQIRHPNVAQILDLGEDNGLLYLAMEWIDGLTVDQLLRKARACRIEIPLPVAIRIAIQAGAGLHAAHELRDVSGELVGLVHRDVSPQNVIVSFDGVTKLVDFGLAKLTGVGVRQRAHSLLVRGKAAYLAPEQLLNSTIDRRVDVFALGIILYVLTTGAHPFVGRTVPATLHKIIAPEPVTPPSQWVPDYPSELEAIVLRCLEKEPARRFATADELVWALESSIPPELRATDQDVAVLVRSVAGDVDGRRLSVLHPADADRSGDSAPPASSASGAYQASQHWREAPTRSDNRVTTGARPRFAWPKIDGPRLVTARPRLRRGVVNTRVLYAALVGTVVALIVTSAFRGTRDDLAEGTRGETRGVTRLRTESPAVVEFASQGRDPTTGQNIGRVGLVVDGASSKSETPVSPVSPGLLRAAGNPGRIRPAQRHVRAAGKPLFAAQKSPTTKDVGFERP